MKTKNQNTDKQLPLHSLRDLRQRLTAAPVTTDQARSVDAVPSDSASELASASGFLAP